MKADFKPFDLYEVNAQGLIRRRVVAETKQFYRFGTRRIAKDRVGETFFRSVEAAKLATYSRLRECLKVTTEEMEAVERW